MRSVLQVDWVRRESAWERRQESSMEPRAVPEGPGKGAWTEAETGGGWNGHED